jgi:glycerol-3-phosphate dehydrogenase
MFDGARFASDMGKSFGPLSEREINYLVAEEFVREPDDILWRRSNWDFIFLLKNSRRCANT